MGLFNRPLQQLVRQCRQPPHFKSASSGFCHYTRYLSSQHRLPPYSTRPYSSETSPNIDDGAAKPLSPKKKKKIIVGITGATGAILGIKVLQAFQRLNIETHLVISKWGDAVIKYETEHQPQDVRSLADFHYSIRDQSARISSGSFHHDGMIVVPCTMKTLSGIRRGACDDLITRAADMTLKERRRLVLVVRETPLNDVHLDNMLGLTRSGAIIFPPVPAFYTRPKSIEEVLDQSVGRMLDMFDLDTEDFERWNGFHWE